MEKLIFLDVDGTICDMNGNIPQSTITAIRTARQNGHKVFLCTGRSKGEIYEKVLNIGFDGLIGGAGAYVEMDEKVLFHECIDESIIKRMRDYFALRKTLLVFETNNGIYIEDEAVEILKRVFKSGHEAVKDDDEDFFGILNPIGTLAQAKEVNKALFFQSSISAQEIQEEFKEDLMVLPNSIGTFGGVSGEISNKHINKATGIQIVLEYLGKTKDAVIAIGDGPNDIEMIEFAGIGIAMGNAQEVLKSLANEVTDSVLENGIYNSFKKHELI
jgi:Cof subfamily protein (haloacid dehalogenase superfamily)